MSLSFLEDKLARVKAETLRLGIVACTSSLAAMQSSLAKVHSGMKVRLPSCPMDAQIIQENTLPRRKIVCHLWRNLGSR